MEQQMATEQLQEDLIEDAELQGEQADEVEESAESETQEQEEPDEVVVTIGDEEPQEEVEEKAAPQWVKNLRKEHREAQRELRELRAKLDKSEPEKKTPALGPKPTLEGCDYDAEKFEQDLTAYHERKRQIDQAAEQEQKQAQAQQEAWKARLDSYAAAKTGLKVKDFEDAEAVVMDMFDETQQGLIIDVMDNPAHVVYALGKNRGIAEKLAAIKQPTKFLRELSRLEDTKLKVQSRKAAPPPEKTVSGTGKISGSVDSTLERLRAEAEKTGDMTKVMAYKKQQREKARG